MTGIHSKEFTLAEIVDSAERIEQFAVAVDGLGYGRVSADREAIDERLPPDHPLDTVEAEALFVGLVRNGVAERISRGTPFEEARFELNVEQAVALLREQVVARTALDRHGGTDEAGGDVQFVATVPQSLGIDLPQSVDDLDVRVRSLLLKAEDTVRIANPYFDPSHPTVETLQTLPRRGIETRVLTRSVEPGTDRHEVLSTMTATLSQSERESVEIVELFAETDGGRQEYATHAKLAIVDGSSCYLGSANLTATNLGSNFEFGVCLGGDRVRTVASVFDEMFAAGRRVSFRE